MRHLKSNAVKKRQMTFVIFKSNVICSRQLTSNDVIWLQMTWRVSYDVSCCFLTTMTIFDHFWRLMTTFKIKKIQKKYMTILTINDLSVILFDVIWRPMTLIDVNLIQITVSLLIRIKKINFLRMIIKLFIKIGWCENSSSFGATWRPVDIWLSSI